MLPDPVSNPGLRLRYAARPDSRRTAVSYWRKYVHEVLVNRLGGLSLPRKSVVRLTGRPDMTLDVYRGRKTTTQQHKPSYSSQTSIWFIINLQNESYSKIILM